MITIYEENATDFTGNGLGTLNPISCIVSETINGNYELVLTHPIDKAGKFARIQKERIIRAPVPAAKTPRLQIAGSGGSREIYRVLTGSGERLNMRNGPSMDAKIIGAYRVGTEVVIIDRLSHAEWSEVTTPDGKRGWMWKEWLDYERTEMSGEAAEESIIKEPAILRDQPFRIYKIEPTLTGITAYARHVFYDLMDNMVSSYAPSAETRGAAAFTGLADATEDAHGFTFYSDLDSTAEDVEIIDKNPAEAILDDGGLIEAYGGELMRDWWDVYLMKRIGEVSGMRIREGKNLLGIKYGVDTTNAATRIIPKGEDEDGKPLYLPERYIDSEHIGDYAHVKWSVLEIKDAKEKKKGDEKRTKEECYQLMRDAVKAAYEAGADLPDVTLNVDFINCAETEEYRQYRFLQGIYMGDTVSVTAKRVGVEVAMRMTQYSYDCMKRKYAKMTLGTVDATIDGNMINPRSIGIGTIKGSMIKPGSIGSGQIEDGAVNGLKIALAAIGYAHIGQAAIDQLAANAVTAIRADIRELVAGNITTDQLYADLAVIAAAQITAANIEKANIQWAEIKTLAAEMARIANAEIGTATIDYAKIVDAAIGTAIITEGVGGKLYINRLAVTEANMVQLTVGALMLKAEDGSFVRLIADGEGGVRTEKIEVEGENVADATIPGGKLIENTITARELNVAQIFADQALIRAIKAANIDVADLFAAQATIEALDAYIIKASTIEALKGSLDIWAEEKIKLGIAENPASSVKSGSGILIDKDHVRLFAKETLIAIQSGSGGEETVAKFDEDGVTAVRVQAGNLTYRYDGPTMLYVNPDATSDQLAGGAHFRSLTDACASLNDRTITRDVTISVLGDSYGDAVLANICGGSVTIQGGGRSLIGTMDMKDCTSRIGIYGLTVTQPASSAALSAVWIANCRYVALEESVRISGNGGNNALVVEAGSTVWMLGTELYNAKDLMYAMYGTHVTAQGIKGGGCVNFAVANGCILKMAGSRPEGGFASANAALLVPADPMTLPVNGQSAQPGIPEVRTAAWDYIGSDSYADGWSWIADDDVRQGYNGKRICGVIWFDAAAIRNALNGRTINQASLRLYMMGGVGRGVSVKIQMYGTDKEYEGRTGAPALTKSYGTIGLAAPGEINEIAIPVQAVADLVSGETRALVLLSDDEELYKDRGYSTNYARFAGSTSADAGTCPRLTVTYQ